MVDYGYIADNATRLFGGLLTIQAVTAQINPLQGVLRFGLPTANEDIALFYRVFGGRNATLGLSLLTLSLQGQRKATGTIVAFSVIAGLVDAWICMAHNGRWAGHFVASVMLAGLSWILLS